MYCKKCNGNNVDVQLVAVQKKRGLFKVLCWIGVAVLTCGAGLLLLPLLSRKGSKIKKYAVCKDCGYSWKI